MTLRERPLQIELTDRGGTVVVSLRGSATMETCQEINDHLGRISWPEARGVVVDLEDLDFICSLGLGSLVAAYLRAKRVGIPFRLVSPRPDVRDVLEVTRLDTLLPICESVDDALVRPVVL